MDYYHATSGRGFGPLKYNVHPEMEDFALEIVKRDALIMKQHNVSYFIREPHGDLGEIQMLPKVKNPKIKNPMKDIAGFFVMKSPDGNHVRIPVTQDQIQEMTLDLKMIKPKE